MTTPTKQIAILVPASELETARTAFQSAGFGPHPLSVELSANGELPATHHACQGWFTSEQEAEIQTIVSTIPGATLYQSTETESAFAIAIASAGLVRVVVEEEQAQ